jgi:hypothetical protein
MRITTRVVFDIESGKMLEWEGYDYFGPLILGCGAPQGQQNLAAAQSSYYNTLTSQAEQEFGQASALASEFKNEFEPIFAKGPSQQGWSPEEATAVNTNILTTEGQAVQNALQASNLKTNALGGGNEYVPQGTVKEMQTGVNVSGAEATAQAQQQALIQNYEQGFKNFEMAATGLGEIPALYSGSTGAAGAATQGGSAASQTYNEIAQESFAPWGAALGAVGSLAGDFSFNIGGGKKSSH